jgi:hypothetical protein
VKGLTVEQYEEYSDIISSINALKYLEAESDFSQAVKQDVIDVDKIVALKIEIDRLEVFKPTSSNILLSVEQVRNKIELFIQTNDLPRAKALATDRDISGLLSFKVVIAELKKQLQELSPKSDPCIRENEIEQVPVGCCLYLLYLIKNKINNTVCIVYLIHIDR